MSLLPRPAHDGLLQRHRLQLPGDGGVQGDGGQGVTREGLGRHCALVGQGDISYNERANTLLYAVGWGLVPLRNPWLHPFSALPPALALTTSCSPLFAPAVHDRPQGVANGESEGLQVSPASLPRDGGGMQPQCAALVARPEPCLPPFPAFSDSLPPPRSAGSFPCPCSRQLPTLSPSGLANLPFCFSEVSMLLPPPTPSLPPRYRGSWRRNASLCLMRRTT